MPAKAKVAATPRKRKTKKDEALAANAGGELQGTGAVTPTQEVAGDYVIIQLPIQTDKIKNLMELDSPDPTAQLIDPEPYIPENQFSSVNDSLIEAPGTHSSFDEMIKQNTENYKMNDTHKNCCYWCCHSVGAKEFGMPIKYDMQYKTFTTFGSFCSLECVVAYNYSNHTGSDRMWEIHSWTQMIAEKIGFNTPIRPAPSRYLLKMFNGTLDIEEFRNAHKSNLKTYIMNMPPMIHIQAQMEILNTSFINQKNNITTTDSDKNKLSRKRNVVDMKKSLDSKMNLTITTIQEEEGVGLLLLQTT